MVVAPATDPVASYDSRDGHHDELIGDVGAVRSHWAQLVAEYRTLGGQELTRRQREIQVLLEQDGVTYNAARDQGQNRDWPLDAVPLVVPNSEWATVERGTVQRAELLNLVLSDLYGERKLLRSGAIPAEMILSDPHFVRACDGIQNPGAKQLVLCGTDLIRSSNGRWAVFGHRTQAPSGAAYALENRRAMSRVFPNLFRRSGVERLDPFVDALRSALVAAAPPDVEDPSVVVLSPGPLSETAFEHASIAARLGYPLVQGSDFEMRSGQIGLRTVGGWARVHVILRRVDAAFSDPLALRPDSTLGIPGLVDACRAGQVSVVNTLGSGVLENAGLSSLMSRLCTDLLGTDLLIDSAPAWWCGDDAGRSHVLANLATMLVRPLSNMMHQNPIDASQCSVEELETLRRRIAAQPGQWVGQQRLDPSSAPALVDGALVARPTVLRSFAIADGDSYLAMSGGLARTAPADTNRPITSRAGALSKDIWVLRSASQRRVDPSPIELDPPLLAPTVALPARAAEHLFWLGRYAERAEATVRLIRTVNGRFNEFQDLPAGPGPAALAILLDALTRITGTLPGFVGDDAAERIADPSTELFSLVVNGQRPGTIAHAVHHMFEAIEVVRDQLSVDTWLVVGSLQRELARLAAHDAIDGATTGATAATAAAGGAEDTYGTKTSDLASDTAPDQDAVQADRDEAMTNVLNDLLHGLLSLAGLANESMVRDQGWRFMEAGRRIERARQVTSLVGWMLGTERGDAVENLVLESALGASESIITSRRRYRTSARASTTIDLLYGDVGNPRSLAFQIDRLTESLPLLGGDPGNQPSAAMLILGELKLLVDGTDLNELAVPDETGRRSTLETFATSVQHALMRMSDAVAADAFTRLQPQLAMAAAPTGASTSTETPTLPMPESLGTNR